MPWAFFIRIAAGAVRVAAGGALAAALAYFGIQKAKENFSTKPEKFDDKL